METPAVWIIIRMNWNRWRGRVYFIRHDYEVNIKHAWKVARKYWPLAGRETGRFLKASVFAEE
jgi:hypothetical protein